ncbi:polyhydroxyalkanoic acid system family protein [Caldimonas sp.]|uniref:polyhydroxyalkanoic acid system family protein n=1 Tax=Caldimonas sp. TaxID=2838790 RepID=UPI00391AE749
MSEIAIHREHQLGLARAREIAWQWAEDAEEKFGMDCTVEEGEDCDVVHFTRAGVKGTLTVAADHFELQAQLGFLLGAFAKTIEAEIRKNLDSLLALEARKGAAARKKAAAPAKKAAARKK